MIPRRGLAVVTGASSGIGEAFARRLAAMGLDLALVARRAGRLESLAAELRGGTGGRRAEPIPLDLALPDADTRLAAELARRGLPEVAWLVNSAGFGYNGPVADHDPERQADMIRVNAGAVAALSRRFVGPMLARGAGVIVNVASVVAFLPVPYVATYSATKAFVLSFTEALAEEVAAGGVQVLCLCPGSTETEFFDAAGMRPALRGVPMASAGAVVDAALRGLEAGRRVVVPGRATAFAVRLARLLPRRLVTRVGASIRRPGP